MQRYFAKEKNNNQIILKDSDLHHIKKVMRMNQGDTIEVIYQEKLYLCQIKELEPLNLEITDEIPENNELPLEIVIAIGLVQEQKFDLILQKLTELGITKIVPLKMERSIVKLNDQKTAKKLERWQTICKEASEQSKRNKIPEVTLPQTLKEFLVQESLETNNLKLVCSVKEKQKKISNYLQNIDDYDKIVFVIGPEGGISNEEETFLNDNGFVSISLGNRVLRVETAAMFVASILNYSSMR